MWGSTLANAAIFALLFPAVSTPFSLPICSSRLTPCWQYIIMAIHARPLPLDPYNPSGTDNPLRHPSPFLPIRIPVFTPVIWLNELIVRLISLVGSVGGRGPAGAPSQRGSRRVRSDDVDSVEVVEEGDGTGEAVQMRDFRRQTTSAPRVRVSRGGGGGGIVGGRSRKND
jgi:etoposide-induced 2.4 mRNA